jgi:NADPH:quinone reductase-like Zn-dependent oxidoreductase
MRRVVVRQSHYNTALSEGHRNEEWAKSGLCCVVEHAMLPEFRAESERDVNSALVRISSFACNHREWRTIESASFDHPHVLGSDFCGIIEAVGRDVVGLGVGDRVVSRGHQFAAPMCGTAMGQEKSHQSASVEYQIVPNDALALVPRWALDDMTALFGAGAQTAYALVRRLEITSGAKVLVNAARSNISLCAIQILARRGAYVIATTSSKSQHDRILDCGAHSVIYSPPNPTGPPLAKSLSDLAHKIGGFDCIVDPFFDLYMLQSVGLLTNRGRYATCGALDESRNGPTINESMSDLEMSEAIALSIVRDQTLLFGCCEQREDLDSAFDDIADGSLRVLADSSFLDADADKFLVRNYKDAGRLGKVICSYEQ